MGLLRGRAWAAEAGGWGAADRSAALHRSRQVADARVLMS